MPRQVAKSTEKTAEQRLREIRRIVNETDEALDLLHACEVEVRPRRSMLGGPVEPDQLSVLREAFARIGMALGPAIDPKKNMR